MRRVFGMHAKVLPVFARRAAKRMPEGSAIDAPRNALTLAWCGWGVQHAESAWTGGFGDKLAMVCIRLRRDVSETQIACKGRGPRVQRTELSSTCTRWYAFEITK